MTNIEAGPECDRLVAEAIGARWKRDSIHSELDELWLGDRCLGCLTDDEYPKGPENYWQPSRRWDHAMFAAERARLFDNCTLGTAWRRDGDVWMVESLDGSSTDDALAPTGPLAVCRAILALKGNA